MSLRDRLALGARCTAGSRELADRAAHGSPLYLPDDPRLRSTSALMREAAVFYRRDSRDREVLEREFIDRLPAGRSLRFVVCMVLLGRLVDDEPRSPVDAVAGELARRASRRVSLR